MTDPVARLRRRGNQLTLLWVLCFAAALWGLGLDRIVAGDRVNGWGIAVALSAIVMAWFQRWLRRSRDGAAAGHFEDDLRALGRSRAMPVVVLLLFAPSAVVVATFLSPAVSSEQHACRLLSKWVSHGAGQKGDRHGLILACDDPRLPARLRTDRPPLTHWDQLVEGRDVTVVVERRLTGLKVWTAILPAAPGS